jgi:predicted DNA-binding protein (MmcQ/YjbR family)
MTRDKFNSFCASLPQSTHVIQWGNSNVWKIGGKVYALCGWNDGAHAFTFKVSEMAFEILPDMEGIRPAPYLASRGLKWVQHYAEPGLSEAELRNNITYSYDMIVAKLTKKKRAELGLDVYTA